MGSRHSEWSSACGGTFDCGTGCIVVELNWIESFAF
jgi:hypothetical protein